MKHTFRTTPPATYISPSNEEMREAADKVELRSFSRDLVADLCNLAAGGQVNPPSAYQEQIRRKTEEKLPAPDAWGIWNLGPGSSTKNRQKATEYHVEKSMRYHQSVCDFLQTAELDKFPGDSPLQKAMSLLKLLSKQQGGEGGGEGGEPLPIFQENDNPEKEAEKLHNLMDEVDSLSEDEGELLDPNDDHWEDDTSEEAEEGDQKLNRLKVAEDLSGNKGVMLEVSRKLDQLSKLQVRRQKRLRPDASGEEIWNRPMKHLGELARVEKSAWAMRQQQPSLFLYKAATRQFQVRERVTREEKKQAIFILCDGSGSMHGRKHWKASGVVMNRIKAVISGDAEVYLSVFDSRMGNVSKASTPEEGRALMKQFMDANFSGGNTDIAASVKAAHAYIEGEIKKGAALYRPEVVVLTDEDTSVNSLKKSQIPGTKVHGFAMEVANPDLVKFAKSTGGVGIEKF